MPLKCIKQVKDIYSYLCVGMYVHIYTYLQFVKVQKLKISYCEQELKVSHASFVQW